MPRKLDGITPEFMATCTRCKETLLVSSFVKHKNRARGRASYCKPCASEMSRDYYVRNREKVLASLKANAPARRAYNTEWMRRRRAAMSDEEREVERDKQRVKKNAEYRRNKSRYLKANLRFQLRQWGVVEEEIEATTEALWMGKHGVCDVCGSGPDSRLLDVDHCHTTNRIRGVLCHHCNTALGLLGDDIARIAALAAYLERGDANETPVL